MKKSCWKDKKDWLEWKGTEVQDVADHNDTKTLYCIINRLTGSNNNSNISIKDKNGKLLITQEQEKKSIEHFWKTLNHPDPTTTYDFDAEELQDELPVSTDEITIEEVPSKSLKNNSLVG